MAPKSSFARTSTKNSTKKSSNPNNVPQLDYNKIGDVKAGTITAPDMADINFDFTNTNFNVDKVSADKVTSTDIKADTLADRFMTAADYTIVDPSQIAKEYGDINRSEMTKNAELSSSLALKYLDTELQGLQNYAPAAAALKRRETALDNQFNQQQRDATLAAGDPNLRSDLEAQRLRATAFAEGKVPDSIGDRAFELGIRSRAADAAGASGFGVRSSAAKKASSLMSAEQRIALSQYGDQALTSNIGNRAQLLLAPTEYSNAGQQISVTPTVSGAQAAMQIASEANAGNITADKALSSLTQQGEFKAGLEQEANKVNLATQSAKDLSQAQLNLQAASTNASNSLQAQTVNATNALQAASTNATNSLNAQVSGAQIASQEKQSVAQLQWNTQNANANRSLQAQTANVSNALQAATVNQAARLDVLKTNKTFLFQDQQNRLQQQTQLQAASISASATVRAAGIAAAAQNNAVAANVAMHSQDIQLALKQQKDAMQIYKDNRSAGQTGSLLETGANIITKLPDIVDGISKGFDFISGLF